MRYPCPRARCRIELAVNAMLEKGMLTRDLGGEASTRRIGEAVVAELLA